ncbi:hypothetical protein [Roseibium sp.]|uniref:hypothetical protein n=1 Tax=Roseibium sp. TaxID=1936156 RepID=UPI00391D85D5
MKNMSFQNIQWLTLQEVSELWAPQLKIPPSVILRELQFAFFKIEREYDYLEPLKDAPLKEDLPSAETLINRDFVERFHSKQKWQLPSFWFEGLPTEPSFPGRPSVMSAIVQELTRRRKTREMLSTLAAEARFLEQWANQEFPGEQTPRARSIENGIRSTYGALKRGPR